MTNFERLVEVLKKTFPGTNFCFEELHDYLEDCGGLKCDAIPCDKCKNTDFWMQEYIWQVPKPEKTHTGYMVMVEDEGNFISYSGCIHPSYSIATEEVDMAEYHGWNAHIKPVEFVLKGGEWKNG